MMEVLDLFSAAAGGWSLGMHRAGYRTIAACEFVDWRRALYQQNNPGVKIYDDVRTLTADRLVRDLGRLPSVIVGSPPCQDISPANTKGKGVEGERSGLYFEAIRIIGECRPRWFALENSANLRTRGADAVLAALEALGYACWPFVVSAGDIGANHERKRSWLIGCDLSQVADADGFGWHEGWQGRRGGLDLSIPQNTGNAAEVGCGSWLPRRRTCAVAGPEQPPCRDAADAHRDEVRLPVVSERPVEKAAIPGDADQAGYSADPDQAGQAEIPDDGRGAGRSDDGSRIGQVAVRTADRIPPVGSRSDWSLDDLADRILLDDGLSAWVAQSRIAVGGKRGTSAASLLVEAFGDAVVPQIPFAIGRAILRVEEAMAAVYGARSK